jgi:hypothetical protein
MTAPEVRRVKSTLRGQGPRGLFAGEDEEPARKGKKRTDPCSPSRWYNEVFRGLYEEAAGQPALTGGREYKSAETYFRRLRELNPEMEPGEIYELAGEGAAFMMGREEPRRKRAAGRTCVSAS